MTTAIGYALAALSLLAVGWAAQGLFGDFKSPHRSLEVPTVTKSTGKNAPFSVKNQETALYTSYVENRYSGKHISPPLGWHPIAFWSRRDRPERERAELAQMLDGLVQ